MRKPETKALWHTKCYFVYVIGGEPGKAKKKKIISNTWSVVDNDSHHHSPFISIFGKFSHLKKKNLSLLFAYMKLLT